MDKSILDMDATTLAMKIQNGEISSLEATNTYIEHLEKINPHVNCLVEDRFEAAREEAKAWDERFRLQREEGQMFEKGKEDEQGKSKLNDMEAQQRSDQGNNVGRLAGVPISMKECFDVAHMRTTGGMPYLKDNVKEHDAEIVAKLKAEGAIILGKTNTPALCFCQESENKLYGRTNNPWKLTHTAGGSSGGEGALIAAGGAAVGVGSDIGGSIRFPSHFNGVVGFKSGNNQVSQVGSFPPVTIPLQERMLGIGGMAKSVRDARLINEIIAKEIPEEKDLDQFEIVLPLEHIQYPLNEVSTSLLRRIQDVLKKRFIVIDEQPPNYTDAAELWQLIMSIDGAAGTARFAFGDEKVSTIREYVKELFFKTSEIHSYLSWALIGANLFKPNAKAIKEIENKINEGDQQIGEYLENRLLILPVYHTPTQAHGKVYKEIFSIRKTYLQYMPFVAYANTWGLPALTMPIGKDEEGLPIGIQIISKVGNEDAIFKLGENLEQELRGYERCTIK